MAAPSSLENLKTPNDISTIPTGMPIKTLYTETKKYIIYFFVILYIYINFKNLKHNFEYKF